MNCSVKFFVPIVIVGPCGFGPELDFPPSPPQPASASTRTVAARAAIELPLIIASGYGGLAARRFAGGQLRIRGQREVERAPASLLADRPDPATVVLDDPLAHRQPDARAGVVPVAVQAVERCVGVARRVSGHAGSVGADRGLAKGGRGLG